MRSISKDRKRVAGISLINNVIQSLANGFTLVIFNTVEYCGEKPGWNSADPGKVYATEDGWYHLNASWSFAAAAGGIRTAFFYKNGNAIGPTGTELSRQGTDAAAVNTTQPGGNYDRIIYLKAGEYVTMTVYQNSGGAINSVAGDMTMALMRVA